MTPYLQDPDVTLHQGDSLEVLRSMPDASVHMACTSPPFFGLRDYQAEGQIGLESSPDEWAARLVDVFREVRRVLRDDGTLWVECGDSYSGGGTGDTKSGFNARYFDRPDWEDGKQAEHAQARPKTQHPGHKPKDLIGAPHLLAFALRADGWYLRSCIIWSKPNAMPESVTDRPTTGHSYVFLFSKRPRYFYDAEALREPAEWARWGDQTVPKHDGTETASGWIPAKGKNELLGKRTYDGFNERWNNGGNPTAKNARTVWQIPTEPNALAICRVCDAYWQGGAPRKHCGEKPAAERWDRFKREHPNLAATLSGKQRSMLLSRLTDKYGEPVVQHFAAFPRELVRRMILAGSPPGGTVLDPFAGSGTTGLVARKLGRNCILIELNERYCAMTRARLSQLSLLSELA